MRHAVIGDRSPSSGGLAYHHCALGTHEGKTRCEDHDGSDVAGRFQTRSKVVRMIAISKVLRPDTSCFSVTTTQGKDHHITPADKPLRRFLLTTAEAHFWTLGIRRRSVVDHNESGRSFPRRLADTRLEKSGAAAGVYDRDGIERLARVGRSGRLDLGTGCPLRMRVDASAQDERRGQDTGSSRRSRAALIAFGGGYR
jgi:hypothetical protein